MVLELISSDNDHKYTLSAGDLLGDSVDEMQGTWGRLLNGPADVRSGSGQLERG